MKNCYNLTLDNLPWPRNLEQQIADRCMYWPRGKYETRLNGAISAGIVTTYGLCWVWLCSRLCVWVGEDRVMDARDGRGNIILLLYDDDPGQFYSMWLMPPVNIDLIKQFHMRRIRSQSQREFSHNMIVLWFSMLK